MIVAYTHTDADANVLKGYALEFLELASKRQKQLLKPRTTSNAANIQAVLTATPDEPFIFFGHGRKSPGSLEGQDRLPAINQHNLHLLQDRLVCAQCCYGTGTLHQAALQHNATILSYDGLLILERTAPLVFEEEDCILAGLRALLAGNTAQDAYTATWNAYDAVIQRLLAGSTNDQIMAQKVFMPNQQALRLEGSGTAVL